MKECDVKSYGRELSSDLFQSTHSMKECDGCMFIVIACWTYFNPRTLWKSATNFRTEFTNGFWGFQSTHSMKECDERFLRLMNPTNISIHALYERVRQGHVILHHWLFLFQSTHSMKECDRFCEFLCFRLVNFNPRTLWKSATRGFYA